MMSNLSLIHSTDNSKIKKSVLDLFNSAYPSSNGVIISAGENMNSKNTVKINRVEKGDIKLIFNNPIEIKYRIEDKVFFGSGLLDIEDYGDTLNEMIDNYKDNIISCWRIYVEKEDGELTDEAIEFGKRLKGLMKRVN